MSRERDDLYVGIGLDETTRKPLEGRLEIPGHHFTTHGVIVGMTGSGKTGLGVVLLEEVLRARDPRAHPRSQGRHGEPRADVPGAEARGLRTRGSIPRRLRATA